ncbi:hypothetical protein [Aerococcus urinaeequi]|uniref:hypothetical protein n=1 Tax=Aerococcus urinaeequi TaxID=51665 RepID=UPI003EC65B4B
MMETFMIEYDSSNRLRVVKPPRSIYPIFAHSDYHGERVSWATLDVIYVPREDNYVQIQSLDFCDEEIFSYVHDLAYIIDSHMRLPFETILCECNRYGIRTAVSYNPIQKIFKYVIKNQLNFKKGAN